MRAKPNKRSEWTLRLLGLEREADTSATQGLVLAQIDGLSRTQLERAIARAEMPFLATLLGRKGYRLHALYSGLPSSTPAVQAELFYGVEGAVPAFGFVAHESNQTMRMIEPDAALRIEGPLAMRNHGLLANGSAYANVYTGGAREAHFCVAALGLDRTIKDVNPIALALVLLTNIWSVARALVLGLFEIGLAVADCINGIIAGRDLLGELKFVPSRVAVSVLLREAVRIGAEMDIARGLPVIHINFLGYDEQAHRRGPSSAFAHWTLKGIDDALARIWHAIESSAEPPYQLWIYSDHGQEECIPYARLHGRTIGEAIAAVFERSPRTKTKASRERGVQTERARLLGGRWWGELFPTFSAAARNAHNPHNNMRVVALGPVGFVYGASASDPEERRRVARALVTHAHVPLVLCRDSADAATAWTERGEFRLPEDAGEVLGAAHPFRDEVARDLVALCGHPDAGDFVISGWRPDALPLSFPMENGAHGGPGPEETRAFSLLPGGAPLPATARHYLRPRDLRAAALARLCSRATAPVSR